MVGKRCLRKEGGGRICENPVRLSMYNGAMEAVDYMWVNIWCMLHAKLDCWILSQSCRNTSPMENTLSIKSGLPRWELAVATTILPVAVVLQFHCLFYPTTNFHPGPRLISPAYGLTKRLFPDPVTI